VFASREATVSGMLAMLAARRRDPDVVSGSASSIQAPEITEGPAKMPSPSCVDSNVRVVLGLAELARR